MKITKEIVVDTASKIADKNGLNAISLKNVADALLIRTPSLYNHIESLDGLLREVAHKGMRSMNEKMAESAIGKSGVQALDALGVAYLDFMIEHPGVYETIQWAAWHNNEETDKIYSEYILLLKRVVDAFDFNEKKDDVINALAGLLHGFTTTQLKYVFTNPDSVRKNLCIALEALIKGFCKS